MPELYDSNYVSLQDLHVFRFKLHFEMNMRVGKTSHTEQRFGLIFSTNNKAYRPNAHPLDIVMQQKYQFAIRTRFGNSIK